MKGDRLMVWPANIDSEISRRGGRRVPRDRAVEKPTIKEMEEAARRLGIEYESDPGAARPSEPRMARGRLLITKDRPKAALLGEIARLVKEGRSRSQRR